MTFTRYLLASQTEAPLGLGTEGTESRRDRDCPGLWPHWRMGTLRPNKGGGSRLAGRCLAWKRKARGQKWKGDKGVVASKC